MVSTQAREAIAEMRASKHAPPIPLAQARAEWRARAQLEKLADGADYVACELGGVPCERVTHASAQSHKVFLKLHGGGYCNGECITHRKFASYISKATQRVVVVPNYRLAPEHPFPAALEDARAVYDALIEEGYAPENIAVGGGSSGGGLTLALLLDLKKDNQPMPACATLTSPWTDILCRSNSYDANADADAYMITERLRAAGRDYVANADPDHPQISPINADLSGLPPMLVHVARGEIMLDDSLILVGRAKAAGVVVEFEVWDDMWHGWHFRTPEIPESTEALRRLGAFVQAH